MWNRIRSQGAFLIVADPRRTPTAEHADLHLPVRPGTDLPLLNAMLHVLERDGLLDRTFLERHTRGAEDALTVAADWTPDARRRGVRRARREDIVAAARRFGSTKRAMALWSMGVNQSTRRHAEEPRDPQPLPGDRQHRPAGLRAAVADRPAERDGRARDRRARQRCCPATARWPTPRTAREMRRFWNSPGIAPEPGLAATELVEALEERPDQGRCGSSPPTRSSPSRTPAASPPRCAAPSSSICQDAYFPTETGALAHVLLPAAQWPEKDGTMTNSERRVSLVQRALDPPGEALPDWEIFARVGRALGHREAFPWRTAAAVHAEYVQTTEGRLCDQTGISHTRLRREGPLQWPCPSPEHPGTERLYASRRFATADGRARLAPDAAHRARRPRLARLPARR